MRDYLQGILFWMHMPFSGCLIKPIKKSEAVSSSLLLKAPIKITLYILSVNKIPWKIPSRIISGMINER